MQNRSEQRNAIFPKSMAFHIGDETTHFDQWWDRAVSLDFFFFCTDEVEHSLREVGFAIEETIEREPSPDVVHQSRRSYIFARRPIVP